MKQAERINRDLWNRLAEAHFETPYYDVASFRRGNLSLRAIERAELGIVQGKTLLHLQCHFGLDTLSWARLGAQVTGVDFSPRAIKMAREIAKEAKIEDARFLCSNVYDLDESMLVGSSFDIAFASYGVLTWLSDITRWANPIYSR